MINIANQLREIANELDEIFTATDKPVKGTFEEINEDELEQLKVLNSDFDKWFDIMVENFDLETHYPNSDELRSIKNLVRHGWNAKPSAQGDPGK